MDGAAPGEGGHAADQQRRRRHQLRAARAQPAAARVRPRRASPGAASSCGSADDGETMTTLDDVERTLTGEDLLICDAERAPQAIAGIMGGSTSEVSDTTTEILLESAYFERMGIARSSKRLKLRSESSARFERGIDPEAVAAQRRAGDGAAGRGRGGAGRARRGRRVPGAGRAHPHPAAGQPGERGARHRPRRRRRLELARRPSASSSTTTTPDDAATP